jgi:hypothetical protein
MLINVKDNYEYKTVVRGKFISENFIISRLGRYPYIEKNKVEGNDKLICNSKNISKSVRVLRIKFIDQDKKISRVNIYRIYDDTKKSTSYSKLSPRIDRRLTIPVK